MAERSFASNLRAPDFPAGLDWLNTDRPLSLQDLSPNPPKDGV